MKNLYTLLIAILFTTVSIAQNGINYKAIVKDGSGNLVTNDLIQVNFKILQGVSQTNVYEESHTPTTDANGFIILNIGEGTIITGDFATIDWSSDDTFLNVQINTGAGLVDIGATAFKAVPYAIHATTASNVTGLEALDEGNGIGWRLKGRDPTNYGNIGLNAVNLSYNYFANDSYGAFGENSTTMGSGTTASGQSSTAMGSRTTASGIYSTAFGLTTEATGNRSLATGEYTNATGISSTAMGASTNASGNASTAMGGSTTASGYASTAMGSNTNAPSYTETAIGRYNTTYTPNSADSWNVSDRLFVVGNGENFQNKSDALIILKNGSITAPSFNLAEITDDKSLVTKEYVDNSHPQFPEASSGLEAINEGNGIGWRIKGRNPANYANIGNSAIDLSYSLSLSNTNGASGVFSTVMGLNTTASGTWSTAMGRATTASSFASTAMGIYTTASGDNSIAMGHTTTASGDNSTAMGLATEAKGSNTTAMGFFNYDLAGQERLLIVGNGASTSNRSNAFTVYEGTDASLSSNSGYVMIGNNSTNNLVFDTNEIMARSNGNTSTLYLQNDGGSVAVGGTVVHSSDRRLKKDIEVLPYGLKEILQLQPKAYNWKNREQEHKSLGLIAQEVQPLIKELVTTKDDEAKTLGISYTELIPVLINAIKEQQIQIEAQNLKINDMSAELQNTKNLEQRIEKLESTDNQ